MYDAFLFSSPVKDEHRIFPGRSYIIGGFIFFMGFGPAANTVQAKSLTYTSLSKMQKRLLSGFVSSEMDATQNSVQTHAQRVETMPQLAMMGVPKTAGIT